MVASFDKAISPGQEGKVTLTVNTNNRGGKISESANIFSDDPQNPKSKILITAFVKQYISVKPFRVIRLNGYSGEEISKKVTITSHEEKPFKITDITSTIEDKIKYTLSAIENDKSYSFEVQTHPPLKESFQGKIHLKTNSQKKPEIVLVVSAKMKQEVRLSPQYLYFGIIDIGKGVIDPMSLKRTVVVSRVRGSGLIIEKTEPSADWIATKIEKNLNEGNHTVTLLLDKDKLPKGKFGETVKVHAKYGETSEVLNIIVEGEVI